MSNWRLLWGSLKTGEVYGELPAESGSYANALNTPGSFSVTLPLRVTGGTVDSTTFSVGSTVVFFERDGVPMFGGIVWGITADAGNNNMVAQGEGFFSYLSRRYLRPSKSYSNIEQVDIAADIISDPLELLGPDFPLTLSPVDTGVLRDRSYNGTERKSIADIISELAATINGFDFSFEPRYDGAKLGWTFTTTWPKTGRVTDLVLELGSNVDLLGLTQDGTRMANFVTATGAMQSGYRLEATAVDLPARDSYPVLEDVVSYPDVVLVNTLDEYAHYRLNEGRRPINRVSVLLANGAVPSLGGFLVGDRMRVKGSYGWLNIDEQFRLTEISVSIDSNGQEDTSLTLAPIGAFSA